MAAAPAPPSAVEGLAGPAIPDPEARLSLNASAALVVATPMLDWTVEAAVGAGALPRVSMTHAQMVRCFISRCNVGPLPADIAAAAARSVFTAYLNLAAWKRILEELCNGGLFDLLVGATSLAQFWKSMDELVPANPANLLLTAGDWAAAEAFDRAALPRAAAVPGARRGAAGRPAVPAIAAEPGPAALSFLNLANLTLLEVKGQHHPMEVWAKVGGMLGPCATRAARARALSTANVVARMLSSAMTNKFGELDEAGKAINLADFVRSVALTLRPGRTDNHGGGPAGRGSGRPHIPSIRPRQARGGSLSIESPRRQVTPRFNPCNARSPKSASSK